MSGQDVHNNPATNLAYTKFLFVLQTGEDEAARARLRAAGAVIGRGFFNDFEAEGTRDPQPRETIQFFATDGPATGYGLAAARYVVQVSSKYRPRLQETEQELRRRLGDQVDVVAIDGALRPLQYTSAQMHAYAYKRARPRMSGRVLRNAIVIPIRKTREWWEKDPLDRNAFFYPHTDRASGAPVKGHARAAEAGISTVFRRLYHNPDGYGRQNEYDFITYFECADDDLPVFDNVCRALRDERQNPEWRYVIEGPEWRGFRVLRW
jgi:hypothetical protein